ncbi:MAG: hypothetical protein JWM27_3957 [Gemmatimonadetes bacterium]|nr:hypothetical protein [Gemmatimonadota bacterium]
MWNKTTRFRDATIFVTVLDVASDRTASTPARVFAIRTLILLESPELEVGYRNLVGGQNPIAPFPMPNGACMAGRSAAITIEGKPLPAAWRDEIHALKARVLANPAEPEDVRTAAACV